MAKLGINTGSAPNDGNGDTLLSGAVKINSNFNELYALLGNGTALSGVVTSLTAGNGISLSASSGSVQVSSSAGSTADVRANTLVVTGVSTLGTINGNGSGLTNLPAGQLTGTIADARFPSTLPAVSGVNLTGITTLIKAGTDISVVTSGGITTITSTASGTGSTANLRSDSLVVTGVSTLSDLTVTGVSTLGVVTSVTSILATKYYGDGSSLTGVNSERFDTGTLNVTGVSTFNDQVNVYYGKKIVMGEPGYNAGKVQIYTGNGQVNDYFEIDPSVTDDITLRHSGTNARAFKIMSTGNIGINTVDPGAQFDIAANTRVTGVLTATQFSGNVPASNLTGALPALDGSALTGITGSGSGVVVKHDGSTIGTAGTINFSTNLDVSAISAGVVTVTASGGSGTVGTSGTWANYDGVTGVTTTKKVKIQNDLEVTGILTASSLDASISQWELGADGSNNYTFTGPGFTGAENDPTLYLVRGQKYKFKNAMGAHPFRIQSTVNGSAGTAYNDGITNNNVSNGTLSWNVQFDAPDILYYQCTAHNNMGGKIYIGNSGDTSTIGGQVINTTGINVSGVVTATSFVGNLVGIATTATNLADAANITTGTIADARFPATLPAISGANLTNLNAGNLASGTVPDARFPSVLPAIGGQSLTGVTTDVEFASLQAQVNTLANNLNIIGFYNATAGVVTALTVVGESRSYISLGATLPSSGIHTGDYLIVSTNGSNVGIASYLSIGVSTAYSGDWIVGASGTEWEVLSYSSAVVAPRATNADFADTLKSTSSVNTSGIITAASFAGDGTNLTGVASTDYIVTGTAATFNNVAIFNDNLRIADNVKAQFGTGFDLEIYHDGSNSYIGDVGTGALRIGYNGTPELYHGTSKKLETVSTGATVTGTMFATQFSGGGLMAERTTVSGVTTAIAQLGIGHTDITGFKSYALMKVGLSTAGWFRLYTDSTSRTNDLSRSVGIDPSPGSGVIAEVVTTGVSTSHIITPFVTGGNMDEPATTTMYASVQNLSGVTTEISVNLTLLQLEA